MEKENELIKYYFTSIIADRQCAKSLYVQAFKHFLLKKNDETYFANILGNCENFKLSKKYNKNNIAVLPVHYNSDTKEFNKSYDLIIDNFLTPIISKLMSIVFDNNFEIDFYNKFKCKYFIPILEAEYSRMAKEDLDYNSEKPFIICIESAISSFLIDENYVNSISDKILSKLKKSLKDFKFVPVSISDTRENIIGDSLKLLDYFSTTYKSISKEDDLYSLIKSVIAIGKDNYNKKDMEYKLDFYSMIEKIDFDKYMELIELIESQHEDETVKEDVEESIPSKEETSKDEENKEEVSTDKENESGETDKDAVNDSSDNKKDEVSTDENKTPTEEEVKVPTTEEVEDKVESPTVNEVETPIVSEEKTPAVEEAPTEEVEENKKDNSSSNDKETEKDVTVENNEGSSQDIEKPSNETTSEKSNE